MNINFKSIIGSTLVASALLLGVSTLTSCGKDGCTDANATNYDADATTDDNSCTYDRDKFIGTYAMNDQCTSDPSINYTLTIQAATASTAKVTVKGLSFFTAFSTDADVNGTVFTFSGYSLNGNTFAGSGTLSGSTLTVIYTIVNNGTTDNCTGTGIKQ